MLVKKRGGGQKKYSLLLPAILKLKSLISISDIPCHKEKILYLHFLKALQAIVLPYHLQQDSIVNLNLLVAVDKDECQLPELLAWQDVQVNNTTDKSTQTKQI